MLAAPEPAVWAARCVPVSPSLHWRQQMLLVRAPAAQLCHVLLPRLQLQPPLPGLAGVAGTGVVSMWVLA